MFLVQLQFRAQLAQSVPVNLATVIPSAMIFVPCKDGVSHNELEDATQADCAAGANVLLHTVLSLAGAAD